MDLSLITARISDQVAALAVGDRVLGTAELEAARRNPELIIKPSAFVVYLGDTPLDQSPIPGQTPRFREDFAVVLAIDNSLDPRGAAAVAALDPLMASVKAALVGWSISSSYLPCFYGGSVHTDMDASVLLHSLNFTAIVPGGSIFHYKITFNVGLLAGADVPTLFALYETNVDGVLGANTRLDSDYLLDRETVPESATRYQLREVIVGMDDRVDTSADVSQIGVELEVVHHLAPAAVERTYTETTMRIAQQALLPPSFWRDSTLTREVIDAPLISFGSDLGRE